MNLIKYCLGMIALYSVFAVSAAQAANPDCAQVRAAYQCPAEKKKITLSFDDGIADVTPKVLDILKREKIQGTFFILGNKVDCGIYQKSCQQNGPGSAQCNSLNLCKQRLGTLSRMKREGHMIGAHS
jgi:peptidoglycan/xylan/chitin deacetylase (PgdA/CDA1 family)